MKKNKKKRTRRKPQEFWESYSDMMAVILLVFVMTLAGSILQSKFELEDQMTAMQQQESELEELEMAFLDKTRELEDRDSEYLQESEMVAEQESELDEQNRRLEAQMALNASLNRELTQKESELEVFKSKYDKSSDKLEQKESELDVFKNKYDKLSDQLESEQEAGKKLQEDYASQQEELSNKSNALDQILGIRKSLVEELRKEFSDTMLTVDAQSGAISFSTDLMFEYNSTVLQENGKTFLESFFPRYVEILMKDEFREYVSEIIIEGHADSKGSYLYNLELSQNRALAVASFFLSDTGDVFTSEERDLLRQIITANGRSWSHPILDENGKEDADASRRVEIQFRLKDEEMIRQMSEVLTD